MNRPTDHFAADPLRKNLKSLAVRGGTATIAGQTISMVLNVLSMMALGRILTPGDFGLIDMVFPIIGFIMLFKDLGLSQATVQKEEITHEQVTNLFWVNVGASALMTLVTFGIARYIAEFYGEPELTKITMVIAIGFFLSGLTVQHQAILRRQMKFRSLAVIEAGSQTAGIVAAIAAALAGMSYWALVIKLLVSAGVNEVAVWVACGWRPGLPKRGVGSFAMLSFGVHLTFSSILNYMSVYLANVLIGRFYGTTQVAYFGRARQLLVQPVQRINAPLTAVAVSMLSRLNSEPAAYRSAYTRLLEKIAMVAMPLGALLIADADWVVQVMLGDQWGAAAPIFQTLGVAVFVMPVGFTVSWLLISQGRSQDLLKWGVIDGIVTIGVITAGLPWGVTGVAAGYGYGTAFLRIPLQFWYAARKGPVHIFDIYRAAAMPVIISVAVMCAVILFRRLVTLSFLPGLAVTTLLTGALTLILFWIVPATRRGMQDGITLLRELLRK